MGAVDLESGWTNMLKDLDKASYKTMQAVMQETAYELEIIS